MKLVLHNYWRSSASYRVRIALGLKQLAYDYAVVNIMRGGENDTGEQKTAAYREKNAMMQVPTLEVIEDDGTSRFLQQSVAILEYLEERWPTPPLLPEKDLYLRARARALAEVVNSGIQPHQNLSTTRKVLAIGGDDKVWVQGFIADGNVAAFERQVQETAGRFCIGDTPTLADCCLIPQLYSATRFGVPLEQFPFLTLIHRACSDLPAFAAAHPDRQPDAVTVK